MSVNPLVRPVPDSVRNQKKEKDAKIWHECIIALIRSRPDMCLSEFVKGADDYIEEYNKRFKAD